MADADKTSPWRMNGRVSHVRKEHPHGCDYQGCRLHLCGVGPQLRRGNCHQDDRSGRFIIHKFTPGAGHVLRISGRGVPANFIVSTVSEHVNVLARILLNAVYDARAIR